MFMIPGLQHSRYVIEDGYIANGTLTWLITHHLYMPQRWCIIKAMKIWLLEGTYFINNMALSEIKIKSHSIKIKISYNKVKNTTKCKENISIYHMDHEDICLCMFVLTCGWIIRQCHCHCPRALPLPQGQ